jgi:hypothetical protein
MIQIVRRRNARRVVAYSWSEKTGMALRRYEGAGGPPSADEVFHGLCYLTPEQREKIR